MQQYVLDYSTCGPLCNLLLRSENSALWSFLTFHHFYHYLIIINHPSNIYLLFSHNPFSVISHSTPLILSSCTLPWPLLPIHFFSQTNFPKAFLSIQLEMLQPEKEIMWTRNKGWLSNIQQRLSNFRETCWSLMIQEGMSSYNSDSY